MYQARFHGFSKSYPGSSHQVGATSPDFYPPYAEWLGFENAAPIAVALTVEKVHRHEVTSAGGYLRALTARSRTGDLHLARSIFGMAFRNMMASP